jgi:hypothetical protein
MLIDADVYVCPNFATLFDMYLDEHHLYAATIASGLFSSTRGDPKALRPGMTDEFLRFPERNLGFQLIHTANHRALELLALFRDVYARHVNDESIYTLGDQASFREALFTMRPLIRDVVIPVTIGCRYVGGCDDGCLTVHRHWNQDKSGDAVESWKFLQFVPKMTDESGKAV